MLEQKNRRDLYAKKIIKTDKLLKKFHRFVRYTHKFSFNLSLSLKKRFPKNGLGFSLNDETK